MGIFQAICHRLQDEDKNKKQLNFAQEMCFGNVVLAPYFSLAVFVDLLREICALLTRTSATIMQTSEERQENYFKMG